MQSLAADRSQTAQQVDFRYPENWVLVARTVAALSVMLCIAHAGLVLIPMVTRRTGSAASLLSWSTLGVLLGVVVAGLVVGVVANLFPTIRVSEQGLGISELTGWRYIPWKQISVLRVMELRDTNRYVLLVPFSGKTKPATPSLLFSVLPPVLGASGWGGQGLLLTSDIKDFDNLVKLIVTHMMQASGQNPNSTPLEAYVDEGALMPIAQLFLEPETELARIASNTNTSTNIYGVSEEETEPPVTWNTVLKRQALIAAVPVAVLASDVLMRNHQRPFVLDHIIWAVLLFALGVAELPFVAMLVRAVGELMVGSGQFNRTVWAYLELQVPRAFLVAAGGALLSLGLPPFFTQVFWFAGIVITTYLAVRYVQRLYYMPATHTLLSGLGTFIFQLSLLALYIGVR
jgi:hypothetical protein